MGSPRRAAAGGRIREITVGAKRRVLVVEDNRLNLELTTISDVSMPNVGARRGGRREAGRSLKLTLR